VLILAERDADRSRTALDFAGVVTARVMTNFALRRYHEATKHSRESVAAGARPLDFSNKPLAFKVYTALDPIVAPPDIAELCLYSNGVLRWGEARTGQKYGFRAAPCTGALYHVELYLATAPRPDLATGLYHYSAHDGALRLIRAGDVRGALVSATGGFAPVAGAPIVAVLTSTFWRNAWKYRSRAYRHVYWDGGVILANLLALAAARGTRASVVMGFADAAVDQLVGADGAREASFALVALGDGATAAARPAALPVLDLETEPLSSREERYPLIEEAHHASSLGSGEEAAAWRARADAVSTSMPAQLTDRPIEEVIRARRSTRQFTLRPITREQLDAALAAAIAPIPGDAFGAHVVDPFLIVNAVEGLDAGTYRGDLTPIRRGDFRSEAGELALGQRLGADAAANVYWLADLDAVLARFGERGYRVAQLAGGMAGGRLELAATDMRLGATGLTFFDDEVTDFFEPVASGRPVTYVAAIGRRARVPRR